MKPKYSKARYVRCSTSSQNPVSQIALQHPDEKLYVDMISGSIDLGKRPEGKKLIEDVEAGLINYISCHSIDRLGRGTTSIINQLQYFQDKGVVLKIDNLGIESILPDGKPNDIFTLICTVLANISQMTKTSILEKQELGIKAAKDRGDVYKGRMKGTSESDEVFLSKHLPVVKVLKKFPEMSLRELAKQATKDDYKPSPNTVKKVKEILKSKHENKQ